MSHLEFIMVFILVLMAGAFGIAAAIVRRRGETKTTVKRDRPAEIRKFNEEQRQLIIEQPPYKLEPPNLEAALLSSMNDRINKLEDTIKEMSLIMPTSVDEELPFIPEATELITEPPVSEIIETIAALPVFKDKPILKCLRCGKHWQQRGDTKPKHCPGCGSALWNKRVNK